MTGKTQVVLAGIFLVGIIGAAIALVVGTRLVKSEERPQPTLLPTAHITLFQPANTPTPPPSPTPSLTATATTTPSATPTATPVPPTATATATLPPGVTPSPTPPVPPALTLVPGSPQPYLEQFRLVSFYGVPTGLQLGILGAAPRPEMLQQLRGVAAQYQALSPDRFVMPTFHIIVTIADPYPGEFGNYNHWLNPDIMEEWITAAGEEGVAVILDIQPGHASIDFEVNRLKEFLYLPHVHLALDSEFVMEGNEIPGRSLGQIYASQINPVQEILNGIALETGLNKVLIIHQFDSVMVRNKELIEDYPYVELVFDADGFGSPQAKMADYNQYAAEPGFEYGGFKLFFGWDVPVLTPGEVMGLEPRPAVIIYQ